MVDQPFTPMHAVDTVSNATDAALGQIENRIARLEQVVVDTNKQIARTFAGLLRDLETAPAPASSNGNGNGNGNGDDAGVVVVVDGKPLDPTAAVKPDRGDKGDKPGDPPRRRHRLI